MRKNHYTTLCFLGILSLFLIFSNCGKKDEKAANDAAKQLLETFNKIPIGMTTQVDEGNITAETSGDRFLITYKNPSVTFDTAIFKSFNLGDQFKEMKIPITFEELTYLYGPEEKYLEFVSAKGFAFKIDMAELIKLPEMKEEEEEGEEEGEKEEGEKEEGEKEESEEGKEEAKTPADFKMKLDFSMGKMAFKGYNISALLTYQGQDLLELAGLIIKDNKSLESSAENFKYQVDFVSKEKENMSILVEIEKIEGIQKSVSDIFLALYKKDTEPPDFAKALQEGAPIIDLSARCSKLKVTVKKDGTEIGNGFLEDTAFSYYLKPNDAKTFFNYGSAWSLEGLSLNIPDKKEIELFGNIKEMNIKFSLENISADFGKAYFDLVKKSMAMSHEADKEKLKKEQAGMAMGIIGEFMKSQPVVKFSISPFKHHYGEMTASANFSMPTMMTPAGKAEVKISKINDILAKLKEEKMITPETLTGIEETIKKVFVVDANGDGVLTFEIKADQPGKYFLNGNEMGK